MFRQRGITTILATAALALVTALPAAAQLPEGFTARNIGDGDGSTTVENGKWTVRGQGADLWGNDNDHFHFVARPVTGDGNITARLLGTRDGHAEDGWEKVGAMIRENDTQGSPHATTYMSNRGGGLYFMWREEQDGATREFPGFAPRRFPIHLRTQRVGNEFSGYYSWDGVFWNYTTTQNVSMGETANFGLHAMSHDPELMMTTEWDNVSVNPGQTQVYGLQACSNENGVLLTWKPLKGAQSYNIYRGPAGVALADLKQDQLQKINADTVAQASYSDTGDALAPGARFVYAVSAVSNGQEGPLTVLASGKAGPAAPPAGFNYTVIGDNSEGDCAVGSVGVSVDANGVITMRSGGHDIWDDGDDFTFLHQKVSGNFRITVTMLQNPTATSSWSKAGPMIREKLTRGSRNAMLEVTGFEGVQAQFRAEEDSFSETAGDRALQWYEQRDAFEKGAIHLRLTREGDTITPEYSLDGTNFEWAGDPIEIADLANELEVGVAHTSHQTGRISEVRFRDIKIEKL